MHPLIELSLSWSATMSVVDDDGTQHGDPLEVARSVALLVSTLHGVDVFTVAAGDGIDTETGDREPVAILQGSATYRGYAPGYEGWMNAHSIADRVLDVIGGVARTMNQRAIGWYVTEDDTYRSVSPYSLPGDARRY